MLYVYAVCVTCDLGFPLGINKVFLHLLWMKALGLSTDSPSIDITAQPRRPNGNRTWTGSRRTWREACGCGTCSEDGVLLPPQFHDHQVSDLRVGGEQEGDGAVPLQGRAAGAEKGDV